MMTPVPRELVLPLWPLLPPLLRTELLARMIRARDRANCRDVLDGCFAPDDALFVDELPPPPLLFLCKRNRDKIEKINKKNEHRFEYVLENLPF